MKLTSLLTLGLLITISVTAAEADKLDPVITVTGEGHVSAAPDMAIVTTGVITRGDTASEALSENNSAMARVMGSLGQYDIEQSDVQTSGFKVQPELNYRNREQPPTISGYRVTNGVTVNVRDLNNLAKVLDGLVQAGSNQISGIRFTFEDASSLEDQARRRAYRNARARAETYAEEASVKLGKVRFVTEGPVSVPIPRHASRMAAAEATPVVPIALGENEIQVTVEVVFGIVY